MTFKLANIHPVNPGHTPAASEVRCDTGNGHGTTDTKIRRFTNATVTGDAITHTSTAANGDTFTINEDGVYTVGYTDVRIAANASLGISVNSTQLTTAIHSISVADRVIKTDSPSGVFSSCSASIRLSAGDIIRTHTDGTVDSTSDRVQFIITQTERTDPALTHTLVEDNLSNWANWTPSSVQGFTSDGTTDTGTWTNIEYRRDGPDLLMRGYFTTGATQAAEARLSLPTGLTTGGIGTNVTVSGRGKLDTGSIIEDISILATKGQTYVNFGRSLDDNSGDNMHTKQNGNLVVGSSTRVSIEARIPIQGWGDTQNSLIRFSGATPTRNGLVKKNRILYKSQNSTYSTDTTGILLINNVPQGKYRVTVGAAWFRQESNEDSFIAPQLNGSNISLGGGLFTVGLKSTGITAGETGSAAMSGTIYLDFPNATNSFELDIYVTDGTARLDYPYYILEKLENTAEITSEWD